MTTKYTLAAESGLYRLTASVAIPAHSVEISDPGGLVDGPHNLSHAGDCWIGPDACVVDSARITGNGLVTETAFVAGYSVVGEDAVVGGSAVLTGNAVAVGTATLEGDVVARGDAYFDSGVVSGGVYEDGPDTQGGVVIGEI